MSRLNIAPVGASGGRIAIVLVLLTFAVVVSGCSPGGPDTSDPSKSFANVRAARRAKLAQARTAQSQPTVGQSVPTQGTP